MWALFAFGISNFQRYLHCANNFAVSLTSLSQTHLCHWLHWVRLICVIDIEESGLVVKLKQWSQNQQFQVVTTPQSKKKYSSIFQRFFLQLKKMQFHTIVSIVTLFLVQTHLDPRIIGKTVLKMFIFETAESHSTVSLTLLSLTLLWHWYRKVVSCMWH